MTRRLRVLTGSRASGHLVLWLNIGGHKPLAHLPRWRRHLLHLPAVRWRLWPRPWNFNGPVAGWRADRRHQQALIVALCEHVDYDTQLEIFGRA